MFGKVEFPNRPSKLFGDPNIQQANRQVESCEKATLIVTASLLVVTLHSQLEIKMY